MSNDYFDNATQTPLTPATIARAGAVETKFTAVTTGLDKLPTEARLKQGTTNYCGASGGSANAYTMTLPYAPASYADGLEVVFKANHTNTGAATGNVNSLGAVSIVRRDGTALSANDLVANKIYRVRYNSTSGYLEIQDSVGVSATGAVATSAETIHVSSNDSTYGYLEDKITVDSTLTKATQNDGADENIQLSVTNALTADQAAACAGTGTPSASNKFVTNDDARLPTTDENDALAGTGTPSASNKYVTNDDARIPTSDQKDALAGTGTPSAANPYISNDDARIPTSDQKAALVGTGTPGAGDPYVNDSDTRLDNLLSSISNATARSAAEANQWQAICWSEKLSIYVAVSSNGTNPIMTSSNGTTWTARAAAAASGFYGVCWSDDLNLFCAVGVNAVETSPDGITWTSRTPAEANAYNSVCWSSEKTLFVAVSSSGTNRVMTSPDGTTWTARAAAEANSWQSVKYSPSLTLFCAVASDGTNRVMTSSNGTSWTARSAAEANSWQSLDWSEELSIFAAVSESGTNRVMTSADGITWTARSAAAQYAWNDVVWAEELSLFCAVSGFSSLMYSPDGTTWTAIAASATQSWTALAWSKSLQILVAVSLEGANRVMTVDGTSKRTPSRLQKDALGGTGAPSLTNPFVNSDDARLNFGRKAGCGLTRTSGTTITIAAGLWSDSTNSLGIYLESAMAKTDSAWAQGAGNGGYAGSGAIAGGNFYHVFLIAHANGNVDAGFDDSLTAANLLSASGYTYYRRIATIYYEAGPQWKDFVNHGDLFLYVDPVEDLSATATHTGSYTQRTLTMPTGVTMTAKLMVNIVVTNDTSDAEAFGLIVGNGVTASSPSGTNFNTTARRASGPASSYNGHNHKLDVITSNASAYVQWDSALSGASYELVTLGWLDTRES